MRSEKEIKEKILELLDRENECCIHGDIAGEDSIDSEIYALRWVLGERDNM